MEVLRIAVLLSSKYKGLLMILFPFISGLTPFSPGGVHVDGHFNLFAGGFAHQG